VDLFPQVYSISEPVIRGILAGENDMDIDSSSGGPSSKAISEKTLAKALGALLKSINPKARSGTELSKSLSQALDLILTALPRNIRPVQEAVYEGLKSVFDRLAGLDDIPDSLENVLVEYVAVLFGLEEQPEQNRILAADAATAMVALSSKQVRFRRLQTALDQEVRKARGQERSFSVQQRLDQAILGLGS